jgi:predicted  nucleic acid-binding Zn-ribbon protein
MKGLRNDVIEAQRFLRAARNDLTRLRAALEASRQEVSRAKLELAKARETLAEIRSGPVAEVTKSHTLSREPMEETARLIAGVSKTSVEQLEEACRRECPEATGGLSV